MTFPERYRSPNHELTFLLRLSNKDLAGLTMGLLRQVSKHKKAPDDRLIC